MLPFDCGLHKERSALRSGRNSGLVRPHAIFATELFTLVCILFLALCGCSPAVHCTDTGGLKACPRVLFIGNSYTYVNDLPGTLAALARSGGHVVETGMAASGGWTLTQHSNSAQTLDQLGSAKWDYVVLQEQSEIPSMESSRNQEMYPAARWLVQKIRQNGAQPVFFLTWAHRDGWPENGLADYESMQLQTNQGYLAIANELSARVAPVGYAWLTAWLQDPGVGLWQADGSHPSVQGTYLAACVFYAVLFRQSPEGLRYTDGLPAKTARYLQSLAASTVLNAPGQWNLP